MTRSILVLPLSCTMNQRARLGARLGVGLLLAAGLALGACDRKDPSGKAITGASRQMGAVAAANSTPGTSASYLEPRLSAIRRDVKELGSDPSAMDTASASVISARASGGLAGIKASQASMLEADARRQALVVYAALDAYTAQASFAAGLEQFDPAPETKRLTDEVGVKEQEISKAAAVKRQLQDEAGKLESDAQTALSAAQAERTTEASVRSGAQNLTGQAKTDLITKANVHRRGADGHDKRAADLRAQGAVLAPRIEGADRELTHLTGQRKLLQDAQAEIQAMSTASKQRAAEARASVATSAESISTDIATLEKTRAEIDAPAKAAADGYRSAAGEARKAAQGASREGKGAATLAAAGYLADAGGVMAMRADGFRAQAALLEALADAKPTLPGADKYAASAADARKGEEVARKAAGELFGQAKDAVAGAGGGEELKALTERVTAALTALSENTVEPAKSLALGGEASKGSGGGGSTPAGGTAPAGSGDGAPASGAEGEIRAMLGSLAGVFESMDPAALERVIIAPPGPLKDMFAALGDLDKAMHEKFKMGLGEATKQAGLPTMADELSAMPVPALADIKVTVSGPESGSIQLDAGGMPLVIPVKKVNGAWALDLAGSPALQPMLGMMGAQMSGQIAEMKKFATDIRAGKYPDAATAAKAMDEASKKPGGGG